MKETIKQIKEYVPFDTNINYTKEQLLELISKEIYITEITINNLYQFNYTKQTKKELISKYNKLTNAYSRILRNKIGE